MKINRAGVARDVSSTLRTNPRIAAEGRVSDPPATSKDQRQPGRRSAARGLRRSWASAQSPPAASRNGLVRPSISKAMRMPEVETPGDWSAQQLALPGEGTPRSRGQGNTLRHAAASQPGCRSVATPASPSARSRIGAEGDRAGLPIPALSRCRHLGAQLVSPPEAAARSQQRWRRWTAQAEWR